MLTIAVVYGDFESHHSKYMKDNLKYELSQLGIHLENKNRDTLVAEGLTIYFKNILQSESLLNKLTHIDKLFVRKTDMRNNEKPFEPFKDNIVNLEHSTHSIHQIVCYLKEYYLEDEEMVDGFYYHRGLKKICTKQVSSHILKKTIDPYYFSTKEECKDAHLTNELEKLNIVENELRKLEERKSEILSNIDTIKSL